jgi:hypothetical protein
MMSSVIPARLEFQCGHAALVSLPRVKGESPAQRNDRIAREKSAAQSRSCDFCPPMAVIEVAEAVVVVAAQPAPALPPVAAPEPVVALAPEPVVALVEPAIALSEPVIALPEPVITLPVPVVALPVPVVAPLPVRAVPAISAAAVPSPKTRVARARQKPVSVVHNGQVTSYRFVVRFRTEAILQATDIRDALHQAESLGATELLALTRTS